MIHYKVLNGKARKATLDPVGILKIKGCIYGPRVGDSVRLILEETHCSRYSIHLGVAKKYCDL